MLNIPMEAFEEFCRAKTNFYIFEKTGNGKVEEQLMTIRRPSWFSDENVMVSTAPTCGLTKGGRSLPKIHPGTGKRIQVIDSETLELIDAIDDQLLLDMEALSAGGTTETLRFIPRSEISLRTAVPVYYDYRF